MRRHGFPASTAAAASRSSSERRSPPRTLPEHRGERARRERTDAIAAGIEEDTGLGQRVGQACGALLDHAPAPRVRRGIADAAESRQAVDREQARAAHAVVIVERQADWDDFERQRTLQVAQSVPKFGRERGTGQRRAPRLGQVQESCRTKAGGSSRSGSQANTASSRVSVAIRSPCLPTRRRRACARVGLFACRERQERRIRLLQERQEGCARRDRVEIGQHLAERAARILLDQHRGAARHPGPDRNVRLPKPARNPQPE